MPIRATHRVLAQCLISLCILACSGGSGSGTDAATDAPDADDGFEIEGPALPEPPALPVFTPCPDGWREVEDEDTGVVICDPWPEGGPLDCEADEAHFPGEPGCVRIGSACPTGAWADDLPTDREILYVRAGEPSGGDGTIGSPFGAIADAMAAADPLDVVAVSKGTFDEIVTLRPAVTLWGACVAETVVASSVVAPAGGTIVVAGGDTEVRNLTLGGASPAIRVYGASRTVSVTHVVVDGAAGYGILVMEGGHASCDGVAVRNTGSDDERLNGIGLAAVGGSSAEVTRSVFVNNREYGVFTGGAGGSLVMSDAAVLDTRERELDGMDGMGLVVQEGSGAQVSRSVVSGSRMIGVYVNSPDTSVELTDVVVSATRHQLSDESGGSGLFVQLDAACSMTRARIVGNMQYGVSVAQDGVLSMQDVLVSGTLPNLREGAEGYGLRLAAGAQVDATRCVLDANRTVGVVVGDAGSRLLITDLAVRGTLGRQNDGSFGDGLLAFGGAHVEVTRGLFEANRNYGVSAFLEGTEVVLVETTIAGTQEKECAVDTCSDQGAGMGLGAFGGAHVDASGFLVTGNALCGVQLAHGRDSSGVPLASGGTIDLSDGEVSEHPVGVNVQTEGFDVERLMDGVLYLDNDTNLDMSMLPVPEFGLGDL